MTITDNESATIRSSKGYIQGYIGLAVSDAKKQIIVSAQAIGNSCETEYLSEMLDENTANLSQAGLVRKEDDKITILGDSHYFSEENLRACEDRNIEAIIPDTQQRHQKNSEREKWYTVRDFKYDATGDYYECPQGKRLRYTGKGIRDGKRYIAKVKDCKNCADFSRCMKSKQAQEKIHNGRRLLITESNNPDSLCNKMRAKMNTEEYQEKYSHRIQIVEPVFANIGYCKGLRRFSLRGKTKVNGQWLLYCIVHNLGKCLLGYNAIRYG